MIEPAGSVSRWPAVGRGPGLGASLALRRVAILSVVPLVGSEVWLALTSDHLPHPVATALLRAWLIAGPMLVGLVWWFRRPESRFGPLLVTLGVAAWPLSWQASDHALVYSLGVLGDAPVGFLTFYLCLAFPIGRLEGRIDRLLIGLWTVVLAGFFVVWVLFSPVIFGAGPLATCAPRCPANALQIGTNAELVDVAGDLEIYLGLAVTAGVIAVYLWRLRTATRPRRRALLLVAVTSLLFLPVFFAFNFSARVLEVDPATVEDIRWILAGARVLFPLGFLLALLQADLFAGRALRRLLTELVARPTPKRWRDVIADALDDPSLELGYWDAESACFRQAGGAELRTPDRGFGRLWVPVERRQQSVAAMVTDDVLATDPELLRAAGSATLLAVEHGQLEGELRASRARIVEAGDAERRRIERDLHDSAQQRLVALQVDLSLAGELLEDRPKEQALVERLGLELDEVLAELRGLAHGLYPRVLAWQGVPSALRGVARHAALPVAIDGDGFGRQPEPIERAIYFCCLEALQNAAKHAGAGASVTVHLRRGAGSVDFTVEDDGVGFDPAAATGGAGLTNLADRLAAVGGTLAVDSYPGRGTRIKGSIPT